MKEKKILYSRELSYLTPLNSLKHGNIAKVDVGVLGQHKTESKIAGHPKKATYKIMNLLVYFHVKTT